MHLHPRGTEPPLAQSLVGVCRERAGMERLRCLSPGGNLQGNINWAFWKAIARFQRDGNVLPRSQPLGC